MSDKNISATRELFHFVQGDYGVEATIVQETVGGELDYRLEDVIVVSGSGAVLTPEEAGISLSDIVREYEISKEFQEEDTPDAWDGSNYQWNI